MCRGGACYCYIAVHMLDSLVFGEGSNMQFYCPYVSFEKCRTGISKNGVVNYIFMVYLFDIGVCIKLFFN